MGARAGKAVLVGVKLHFFASKETGCIPGQSLPRAQLIRNGTNEISLSSSKVVLVYPYLLGSTRSEFRFPPLGIGYIASALRENRISVEIIDCTFLHDIDEAFKRVLEATPNVVGIYSMYSMKKNALNLGKRLHQHCDLLVAGGPQPSSSPEDFLDIFDVVVIGEGEQTMTELVSGVPIKKVKGLAFKEEGGEFSRLRGEVRLTQPRSLIEDLDSITYPARDLFDNENYIKYYSWRRKPATSIMSTRGCVYNCDFCSQPIYGETFRERSTENILGEIEEALGLGYERVVFQDDCFTLSKDRVLRFCKQVTDKGLKFDWECLSRGDSLDEETARAMKIAGCSRVFFGLESGNNKILELMNKQTNKDQAVKAIETAKSVGIDTGAFFIIGYPGETDETLLETVNFAGNLNLDYLSFNFPYPIPGTRLYEKLENSLTKQEGAPGRNKLVFKSHISGKKLRFAEFKGMTQHRIRKGLGAFSKIPYGIFKESTDAILRMIS
jgi:anaerobic magnesium-protoporphyrin IX monomethyl ester cyclase